MPACSLWRWWCCRCKVCANGLIVNLKHQICACVGKEGSEEKRSKLSHWIVQSCAPRPTHDWSCFLVPWCKSIVGSADAKWCYFFLMLVQIRGKALALIPGGSDLVFQTLKLPTRAIWGSLCGLLARGFFLCFLWHVLLTLPVIGNNQLFLTVRNWEIRKNVKRLSKGCSTWLGFSSGKGWSGTF